MRKIKDIDRAPLHEAAKEAVRSDLATLRLVPGDEGYNRGEGHLAIVSARTRRDGQAYVSELTRRRAATIREAVVMLQEELTLLVERDWSARQLFEHYVEAEGRPPPSGNRSKLPQLDTLEEALAMEVDVPFVFRRDDVPTPTGKRYKPFQTVKKVRCGDGSFRVVHTADIPQLVGADGFVRSVEQLKVERAARVRAKRAAQREVADGG